MHLPSHRTRLPLVVALSPDMKDRDTANFLSFIIDGVLSAKNTDPENVSIPPFLLRRWLAQNPIQAFAAQVFAAWNARTPPSEPLVVRDGGRTIATIRLHRPTVDPEAPEDTLPLFRIDELDRRQNADLVVRYHNAHIGDLYLKEADAVRAASAAMERIKNRHPQTPGIDAFLCSRWSAGWIAEPLGTRDLRRSLPLSEGQMLTGFAPLPGRFPGFPQRFLNLALPDGSNALEETRAATSAIFTLLGAPEEIDRRPDGHLPR